MENPFTPGYGESPPYLAGRIDLVHKILSQIRRGPGRSDFHHVLIGPRGTGKTSTITAVADQLAREHSGLSRRGRTVDATLNVGLPGAGASATTRQAEPRTRSTFATLQQLGRLAENKNHTILFWIDEAQRATADEVAVLAGCMQEIANVQRLPITICAPGLPDTGSVTKCGRVRRRWPVRGCAIG